MSTPRDHDFDARLRQLHDEAVQQVAPRTRAQLALRQSAAARRPLSARRPVWVLTSACAVGALALGLSWHLRQPTSPLVETAAELTVAAAPPGASISDVDDAYAVFDESPDLYLWLDSEEAMAVLE